MGAAPGPHHDDLRRWLGNLRRPDRLDDPALRALLAGHGRGSAGGGLRAGRAAADLLRDKIESLRPPDDAPTSEALPYRVLRTCFVDGAKSYQAAARLGLSERQLSRERSRAISLLAAELFVPHAATGDGADRRWLARPALAAALAGLRSRGPRVHVTGASGAGKSVLVAEHLAAAPAAFRHAPARHAARGLPALLFELGEHLAPEDPSLASYFRAALAAPRYDLATDIALAALSRAPRLLVVDGIDHEPPGGGIESFLSEAAVRLPSPSIVTVGRGAAPRGVPALEVPPLEVAEVSALLELRGADGDAHVARRLREWTRGNAALVDAAATWLAAGPDGAPGARDALVRAAADLDVVVPNLAGLMWAARRTAA